MAAITDDQLAELKAKWLPDDAESKGWDDARISDEWTGDFPRTIRAYWYDRVQQTARYLDVPGASGTLAITQLHRQAREMLDYWDNWLIRNGTSILPGHNARVGKIKRRYKNQYPYYAPTAPSPYSPYNTTG